MRLSHGGHLKLSEDGYSGLTESKVRKKIEYDHQCNHPHV